MGAKKGAPPLNTRKAIDLNDKMAVLSDGFELVSAWTVTLPFILRRDHATQRERRHGST